MTHIRSHLLAAFAVAGFFMSAPASAQSSACQEGQKILQERQNLIQQINKLSNGKKKQVDPRAACTVFSKLVVNGNAGQKWMTDNKDWCQIPDQVGENLKQEHAKVKELRAQACQAAAKFEQMQKQARQQQQNGNPFGGGLTGQYKMPQGAL